MNTPPMITYETAPLPQDIHGLWGKLGQSALDMCGIEQSSPGCETYFIKGEDGRRIAVETSGPENGHVVVFRHGNPGSRLTLQLTPKELTELGVRLITSDHAGSGFTDARPGGSRPIEAAQDVASIVKYFGIDQGFSVMGRSAGAPEALACAAVLPGVRNVAALVPPGPIEYMGEEAWFRGMGAFNTDIFKEAFNPQGAHIFVRTMLASLTHQIHEDAATLFTTVYDEVEHKVADDMKGAIMRAQAAGLRPGSQGWEDVVFGQARWGFDPRTIDVKTLVWSAGGDVLTPPQHAEWLADNIRDAHHISNADVTHFGGIVAMRQAIEWCRDNQ